MKILVTGACGYKGSVLIPKLLQNGHNVRALDIQWFGNYLIEHPNLEIIKADVRDLDDRHFKDVEIIIHLASVANDPCSDLNPKLTWEISCLSTMNICEKAIKHNIKRIIYASSGSVYGVNDKLEITEETELNPISEYNKTKMCAERILLSYSDKIIIQIVRPATVCGYSPRMRFDVSVNLLTIQALEKKKITVLGGEQTRPNIHIDDIIDLYIFFIENPNYQGIYNAGFENLKIIDIAKSIKEILKEVEIIIKPSNDPRSYRVNSDKLLKLGFKPKKNVKTAILELTELYNQNKILNKDIFNNLIWMKKNNYN